MYFPCLITCCDFFTSHDASSIATQIKIDIPGLYKNVMPLCAICAAMYVIVLSTYKRFKTHWFIIDEER